LIEQINSIRRFRLIDVCPSSSDSPGIHDLPRNRGKRRHPSPNFGKKKAAPGGAAEFREETSKNGSLPAVPGCCRGQE
jgi:hypothetical protein